MGSVAAAGRDAAGADAGGRERPRTTADLREAVFRAAVAAGLVLRELRLETASLEEIFARGDLRPTGDAPVREPCPGNRAPRVGPRYFRTPAGWAVLALFLLLQGLVFWMFVQFLGRPDAPPGGVMEFFFGGTILYWIALGTAGDGGPDAAHRRRAAAPAPSSLC